MRTALRGTFIGHRVRILGLNGLLLKVISGFAVRAGRNWLGLGSRNGQDGFAFGAADFLARGRRRRFDLFSAVATGYKDGVCHSRNPSTFSILWADDGAMRTADSKT